MHRFQLENLEKKSYIVSSLKIQIDSIKFHTCSLGSFQKAMFNYINYRQLMIPHYFSPH